MPSGYCDATGLCNCELPQCVEAKIKAHKDKPAATNKIDRVIDLMIPKLNGEPNFTDDKKKDGISMSDISVALLNMDRDSLLKKLEEDNYQGAMYMIMYRINPYLPDDIRYTTYRAFSHINCREGLKDKIRDFIFAVIGYCMKLEDKLAVKYYSNSKMTNMLEILKRRYRNNWGDSGKSVQVRQTDEETDRTIEIVIRDA